MIVVDSGVWIDYFGGRANPPSDELDRLLGEGQLQIVVPDLVLFEVLRGFRNERDHRQASALLHTLSLQPTGSVALGLAAAQHYRRLRADGITLRSAIDVLLATFCIEHDHLLLHRDRDFNAMEDRCGLRIWRH